jgi:hypothetical protein
MREPGFEEFAGLWQESDVGEHAAVEALARRARRQGRLLAYADIALAVVLVGGMVFGMFMTPQPGTIAAAFLLLATTFWVTWKRRRFRQMTATLNTQGRADFLASSIRVATSNLRRVTLSLVFFPAFVSTALLFRITRTNGGHLDHVLTGLADWARSPRGIFVMIVIIVFTATMIRSRRRVAAELRALERLQRDYEEEGRLEGAD